MRRQFFERKNVVIVEIGRGSLRSVELYKLLLLNNPVLVGINARQPRFGHGERFGLSLLFGEQWRPFELLLRYNEVLGCQPRQQLGMMLLAVQRDRLRAKQDLRAASRQPLEQVLGDR